MPPRPSWSWRAAVSALCTLAVVSPASGQLRPGTAVQGLTQPVAFVQDPSDPAVQYRRRAGRPHPGRAERHACSPTTSSIWPPRLRPGASVACSASRCRPTTRPAGAFFVNFTDLNGNTVVARFTRSAANRLVADSGLACSTSCGPRAERRDPAAVRQPQRREPGVRPRRLPLHRDGRRRVGERPREPRPGPDQRCSGRCCGST